MQSRCPALASSVPLQMRRSQIFCFSLVQCIARFVVISPHSVVGLSVHARRHVLSHVCLSTHLQNLPLQRKIAVPTSLLAVQSHVPNRNYVVATATLVTVMFCFHNSALSCFILNEIFDMLQYQEALLRIHKSCIKRANPNK